MNIVLQAILIMGAGIGAISLMALFLARFTPRTFRDQLQLAIAREDEMRCVCVVPVRQR